MFHESDVLTVKKPCLLPEDVLWDVLSMGHADLTVYAMEVAVTYAHNCHSLCGGFTCSIIRWLHVFHLKVASRVPS